MAEYDGSVHLDVRLNRDDFFKGVNEIKSAIMSLQTTVEAIGAKIGSSTNAYIGSINEKIGETTTLVNEASGGVDNINTASGEAAAQIDKMKESAEGLNSTLNDAANATNNINKDKSKPEQAAESSLNQSITEFMTAANEFFSASSEFENTINESKASLTPSVVGYAEAMRNNVIATQELEAEMDKLKEKRDEIAAKRNDIMRSGEVDPKQYNVVTEELRKVNEELTHLEKLKQEALKPTFIQDWEQMPRFTDMLSDSYNRFVTNVREGFARIKNAGQIGLYAIQHPLEGINRALGAAANGAIKFAQSFGSAVLKGAASAIKSIGSAALHAVANLAKMAGSSAISFLRKLATGAKNAAIQLTKMVGNAVVSGVKKLGSIVGKATKSLLGMNKAAKGDGLKDGLKMIIRYGFGVRSMFMLVRKLRSALVEAFENMAKAVPEVNTVMSQLSASLGQLKNSMATAFQPVLSAIAPMLNSFMNMMTDAMTKVGMFFAALTGQDYVYKAAKANVDLAKSLDKTKKSAKEAENQLAGFDHLNILKAPNDSGSSSGADSNAADSGGFEKIGLLDNIKRFANNLKDMFLRGEFAELGKVLADKVNGLFKSIDLYGIAQKLSGLINSVVAFYNTFMEGIDWGEVGRRFANGINGLLDSVIWVEFGRALSQKINAIWGIIAGLVDNVKWDKLGTSLADAVWGFFGNIKWDLIGETIGEGINGISNAIINFANTFPWKEAGQKIAGGLNNLFDTANLQSVVDAFLGMLNGALDSLLEIVGGFKWGENGEKFRLAVLKLTEKFPAGKLGQLLNNSVKGVLNGLAPVFTDEQIWSNLGSKLGTFLNNLFGDKETWTKVGEIANGALNGILTFGQSFLDTFKADEAADNIKTALGEINFDEIATNTWELIKTAFAKAGSFVDALFSESTEGLSGAALKEANAFNAKPIGARIAEKIKGVFTLDLWKTIATDVWETAKKGFTVAGDFIGTLLGIDTANMDAEERLTAIGKELGVKLGEFANQVGAELAKLPWGTIFSEAFKIIRETISGLISGLLGDSSGNGQILLWVAGGIIALKAGILPLIGKLVMGLASGFAAGGPIMAAGLTAALAVVATAGIVKLTSITVELLDAQREMNEAFGNETESGLSNYVYLWKTYGKEAADVYARKTYGFQTTNESLLENTKKFGEHIAEIQGTTYDRVNTIVSEALGTYKSIFKTQGAEAANEWAQNALYIQTTGANLSENLAYLAEEIEYQATTSTEVGNTIHNACESVKIDVLDASEQTERLISTATDNIESKTSEAAPDIEDNLTTPYSNAVPQVESDMQAIYDAADNGLEQDVKNIEAHMSEASKTYGEKTNEIVNTTETAWNDMSTTQSKALQGMTGNTESGMSQMTSDVATGTTDQRQPVYDNWDMIATFMQLTLEGMKTDVREAMTSMYSAVYGGMNDIVIVASYGMQSLADSVAKEASNVVSAINNVDWEDVGSNIVYGIQDGMIDNWKWLQRTAKNLANNLLQSTKNALGIASPSRLFRDEVGVMLGLGIAEGMEDSQPAILNSVSDVADAMADKMSDTDMAFNVGTDAALDSFGDKIANSFTTLLDRLQTIADRVTFQTPTIATGTVLPYNVQAQSANGSKDIVNALEVSNDDLANVIIQATNNAVSALVDAIRRNGNTSGGDLNTQTSRIIDEINRRTRAQGTSPIIV